MNLAPDQTSTRAGLYLHVGMPKTATTSLQKFVFPEHPGVEYLGKQTQSPGGPYPIAAVHTLLKAARGGQAFFSPDELRTLRQLSDSARRRGKSLVISEELLAAGHLSDRRAAAKLFQQIFHDCRVVVAVREPLAFIESLYFQRLKGFNLQKLSYKLLREYFGEPPRYFDVNQWLDVMWDHPQQPVREYLRYSDNLDMYAACFGRENISVLRFAQLQSDFDGFADDLSKAFDIAPGPVRELLRDRRVNDRWKAGVIDRLKSLERSRVMRWRYLKWSDDRRRRKMLGLAETSDDVSPKARAEISDAWKREIERYSAPQIRKLIADWNVPAEEMGWSPTIALDRGSTGLKSTAAGPPVTPENRSSSRPRKTLRRRNRGWDEFFVDLAARLPYKWGNRLLSRVFSSPQLQLRLFGDAIERMRTVQEWIGRPIELRQAVCRHLLSNAAIDWRLQAFGAMPWRRTQNLLTVEGWEFLEQFRGHRPGTVLVNSHFGEARVAAKLIVENGFEITKIGAGSRPAELARIHCKTLSPKAQSPFWVIREACAELERGRCVYLSADGHYGEGTVETEFLSKRRPFRTGFAQLAVKTGAPVVPVFATVDERGLVHVQFHKPLDCGHSTQPRRERIAALVQQYARLLERYWIDDPGNIRAAQFESHRHDYADYRPGTIPLQLSRRAA